MTHCQRGTGPGRPTGASPTNQWAKAHLEAALSRLLLLSLSLDRAKGAGLKAILVLVGGMGEDVLGLELLMEERREAPLPDDDDNNNKRDSAASRCAFARRFVGLAPAGHPGPVPC